jgi:chromosome segregation ATPase
MDPPDVESLPIDFEVDFDNNASKIQSLEENLWHSKLVYSSLKTKYDKNLRKYNAINQDLNQYREKYENLQTKLVKISRILQIFEGDFFEFDNTLCDLDETKITESIKLKKTECVNLRLELSTLSQTVDSLNQELFRVRENLHKTKQNFRVYFEGSFIFFCRNHCMLILFDL